MAVDRIRRLPEEISNQIAAGEVVERPASVVKELVENALDAGARRVQVDFEDGGVGRIQVTDDGMGMSPADALACLDRHATSKLRTVDDLFSIQTMGFRGEAVPSIASVSRFRLTTRPSEADAGTRIVVHGGEVVEHQAVGAPVGTEVLVEDLFYNVPARKKFLKRVSTETGHLVEAVVRLALAWPDVAFRLTSEGRNHLDVSAQSARDPKGRLARVLGRGRVERMIPIPPDDREHRIDVSGWVGEPGASEKSTRGIYVFVNGRYIRDRGVQHGLQEAYRGLLERGRYPTAVLFLRMDPDGFDVNVHPQKTEVRFRVPQDVHRAVVGAVGRTLQTQVWGTSARTAGQVLRAVESASGGAGSPQTWGGSGAAQAQTRAGSGAAQAGRGVEAGRSDGFDRGSRAEWGRRPERGDRAHRDAALWAQGPMFLPRGAGDAEVVREAPLGEAGAPTTAPPSTPPPVWGGLTDGALGLRETPPQVRGGLLLGRYAVAESAGRIALVDALEGERAARFRDLLGRGTRPEAPQRLLVPQVLELDPASSARIGSGRDELLELGFEVEPFGGDAWALTAVPAGIPAQEVAEQLTAALDDVRPGEARVERWARALARGARIRPGRTEAALQQTVDRMWREGLFTGLDGQALVVNFSESALRRLFDSKG